jgi:N-terminal domain of toast_rack, DUF2154
MMARIPWISALGVLGVAVLVGCDVGSGTTGETRTETVSFDLDDLKAARVELSMGGGEMTVKAGTPKLMEGKFAFNVVEARPVVEYRAGMLSVSQPKNSGSFGDVVNVWDVTLNPELPMDVKADLGAGEANLELGQLNLNRVEMNIGAGEVKMDLRGEPKRSYTVNIRGGVGETVVYLPRDVGISATAVKGIGDISVEGLEQRDGVWVNSERVGGPVTVKVDVKGGIGAIRLVR